MPRTLSEAEFNQIRDRVLSSLPPGLSQADYARAIGPAMEQALGEAENSPAPTQGSATGRFLSGVGEMLNPVTVASAIKTAVTHPVDTITNVYQASAAQGAKAKELANEGRYIEAAGHGLAMLPVIGPAAAEAGEQIAQGDVAGGMGKGVGMLLPAMAPAVVRGAVKVASNVPRIADAAEAAAAQHVTDVVVPRSTSTIARRMGNQVEKIAPRLAEDLAQDGAPMSRSGYQAQMADKLSRAESAIDDANDARLVSQQVKTQPILAAIDKQIAELQATPVDASKATPVYRGQGVRGARTSGSTPEFVAGPDVSAADLPRNAAGYRTMAGEFADEPARAGRPYGQTVEPAPNKSQLDTLRQMRQEVAALGEVAPYESVRRIRQAWDPVAKIKYMPSTMADALKAMGDATGAAKGTAALREGLAATDPASAAAYADYHVFRTANDVLAAAEELERVRPQVGRRIMARLTATLAGEQAAGIPGALAGYLLGPAADSAMQMGFTTKLQTASMLQKLANAVKTGDVGRVEALTHTLQRLRIGNAVAATSPSESQRQTTAPSLQPAWSR